MSSNNATPSPKTLELLLKYEVGGGENYYNKYLSMFTWPKGASGPTIAIGIDCAYYSAQELKDIFNFLEEEKIKLIQGAVGQTGIKGKEYTITLRKAGIQVPWDKALSIFYKKTWSKFRTLAEKTFPGLAELHPDAYGAIVSLVFNRGTSLSGPSRTEMVDIKNLVPKANYKRIAQKVRDMKRLWIGKGLDGLLERREAEAVLIESVLS
jgi:hypothetical protein